SRKQKTWPRVFSTRTVWCLTAIWTQRGSSALSTIWFITSLAEYVTTDHLKNGFAHASGNGLGVRPLAGSSTRSRDGERRRGHFKVRKNLVLDVFPFEDLVTRVRQHDTQENKALVKSEFGMRLAVSAPLEMYLQQGYLYDVSASAYLSWPGITLKESVAQEMRRIERTFVRMASRAYVLPYDFARFDHQPTTDEVVTFQAIT
ncbi:hypothetical protein MTO96_044721, partial [Rhipicephalus appendiculatus]